MSNMEGTSVETTPTTPASEGNPGTGSPEGSGAGTQAVADTFAAEREQYEGRVRSFQSEADRAKARVAELEQQLAARSAGGDGGAGSDPGTTSAFDPDVIVSELESRMSHRTEMRTAAAALESEFEYADPDILAKAHEYESVEALKAAVEESHSAVASFRDSIREETRAEVLAEIQAKYGIQIEAPPPADASVPAGDPTLEQIASWTFQQEREFDAANPGVIDRVLRSAQV
jgi:hypothetical protein